MLRFPLTDEMLNIFCILLRNIGDLALESGGFECFEVCDEKLGHI